MTTATQTTSRPPRAGRSRTAEQKAQEQAATQGMGDLAKRSDAKAQSTLTRVVQRPPENVPKGTISVSRKVLDEAVKIAESFYKQNEEHVSLKEQLALSQHKLANLLHALAVLAVTNAPADELRLAYYDRITDDVEDYEKARWKKTNKTEADPKTADVMGTSWRVYKSQMRSALHAGYDPREFTGDKAGILFKGMAAPRARKPRTPASGVQPTAQQAAAAGVQAMNSNDVAAGMHEALAAAVNAIIKAAKDTHPDDQLKAADVLTKAATTIGKLASKRTLANAKARDQQQAQAAGGEVLT